LEYLKRVEKFYNMLVEQAKQDKISEADFYMLLGVKCKAMNKERKRENLLLNKDDIKFAIPEDRRLQKNYM